MSSKKWRSENPEKVRSYYNKWRVKNLERVASDMRDWRIKNAGHFKEWRKAHSEKNRERLREYSRDYYKKNRDKITAQMRLYGAKRKSYVRKVTPKWANEFFMREIYHLAGLRTKLLGFKWHVDHIVPIQSKLVCGLHVENNLMVIPGTENQRKSNSYWPDMP